MARKKEKTSKPGFQNPGTCTNAGVVDTLEQNIIELAESYINTLNDPERMRDNNGLFVDMLKKIYRYYVKDLLCNSLIENDNKYDLVLLNDLFNIYTSLVYTYKQSTQPNILEFCIFCHIDPSLFNNIRYGLNSSNSNNNYIGGISYRDCTPQDIENVKMWFIECENSLVNGKTVFDIFKLKAIHGYNDNLQAIPVEMQAGVLTASELPDLSGLHKSRIVDSSAPPAE